MPLGWSAAKVQKTKVLKQLSIINRQSEGVKGGDWKKWRFGLEQILLGLENGIVGELRWQIENANLPEEGEKIVNEQIDFRSNVNDGSLFCRRSLLRTREFAVIFWNSRMAHGGCHNCRCLTYCVHCIFLRRLYSKQGRRWVKIDDQALHKKIEHEKARDVLHLLQMLKDEEEWAI